MDHQLSTFVKKVLGFGVFAAICYCLLIVCFGEFVSPFYTKNLSYNVGSAGHIHSRLAEVKTKQNVDLLFLGSSHTYRGFDTRIFERAGFSAFNLGSSSQTPLQTQVLLKRYLNQLKPKLVIYEVYPVCFSLDGIECSLDLNANDQKDWQSILLATKQNHVKLYNSLLFGFYAQLTQRDAAFKEPSINEVDTYIPGGFVQRDMAFCKHKTHPKNKWKILPQQMKAFEENVAYIQSKGIKIIFVQAPITKALYTSYTNNAMIDSKLKQFGTYYNFNKTSQLNDSLDFYDVDHLNQNGVEKFNKQLIQLLQSQHQIH